MTQGILTLTENGVVKIKTIVGCGGYNIEKLRKEILAKELRSIEEIYEQALKSNCGCENCLVVMDESVIKYKGGEELSPRYRETFFKPKFNPRWEYGTAEYTEVVDIANNCVKVKIRIRN